MSPTGVPHPSGRLPVLGDARALDSSKPGQSARRLARELGDIFEIRFGSSPIYFLSSAALAAEANNDDHWEKAVGPSFKSLRRLAGNGLILADNKDPAWATSHEILLPAFNREAMQSYHSTMAETVTELTRRWAAHQGPVDASADMNRLTLEIIGRVGFGYSFDSFTTDSSEFVDAMIRVMEYANRPLQIPWLDRTMGRSAHKRNIADIAFLQRAADEIIEAHQPGESVTLLDRMLTTPSSSGQLMSREQVRNEVLTFLIAGHETSAGTLTFTLHLLSEHPEVMTRARQEVLDLLAGRQPSEMAYEEVAKLRYLRRVVDESMRLWSVAPGYFRKAKGAVQIGGRYDFAKGDWVYVNLLQVHRDPAAWGADADEFDPDRFLPENSRRRSPHAFKPFGVGARACIGRQFALHEIALGLVGILASFDIKSVGDELDVHELVTLKPTGLKLQVSEKAAATPLDR
jgi:cytochrome P450